MSLFQRAARSSRAQAWIRELPAASPLIAAVVFAGGMGIYCSARTLLLAPDLAVMPRDRRVFGDDGIVGETYNFEKGDRYRLIKRQSQPWPEDPAALADYCAKLR